MGRAARLSDGSWMGALMGGQGERAEKIAELEAEIRRLEALNEADRRRLRQEPWPLETFDEHSELTMERAGDEADALAEYRESERRGF
jgi:hypothetical protein